jgi:hypothetical protein
VTVRHTEFTRFDPRKESVAYSNILEGRRNNMGRYDRLRRIRLDPKITLIYRLMRLQFPPGHEAALYRLTVFRVFGFADRTGQFYA